MKNYNKFDLECFIYQYILSKSITAYLVLELRAGKTFWEFSGGNNGDRSMALQYYRLLAGTSFTVSLVRLNSTTTLCSRSACHRVYGS